MEYGVTFVQVIIKFECSLWNFYNQWVSNSKFCTLSFLRLDLQNSACMIFVPFCKILFGEWTRPCNHKGKQVLVQYFKPDLNWDDQLDVKSPPCLFSQVVHRFVEVTCDADVQAEVGKVFCMFSSNDIQTEFIFVVLEAGYFLEYHKFCLGQIHCQGPCLGELVQKIKVLLYTSLVGDRSNSSSANTLSHSLSSHIIIVLTATNFYSKLISFEWNCCHQ